MVNPLRYRGYYYDGESGFYLTGTRYYDPEIGRFINADDTAVLDTDYEKVVQYKLYAYCFNKPVNMDEQDGYWPKWTTNLAKVAISVVAIGIGVVAKGIEIQQIGKLTPTNKSGKGYTGVQYINQRGSLKSFELHFPHKGGTHQQWHWQQNTWNPQTGGITGKSRHWTLFGRRF